MASTSRTGRHPTTNAPRVPAITALLGRRARELERHLPSARAGDNEALHRARVASRRLRETLPVAAAGLKAGRKARRTIRRVTRALGAVREMDVAVQVLDGLAREPQISRASLEDVRGHVLAERDRRREAMLARLEDVDVDKLQRRLAAVELAAKGDTVPWREALAVRVGRRAKRLAAAIDDAGQIYAPDRLHQVRIAVKKLRYALELAAAVRVGSAKPLPAVLKRAQQTLGRLNDLHVIQSRIANVQVDAPARQGAAGGLGAIAGQLEEECRHLHARYIRQAPGLLALARTCRSTVMPELAAIPHRRPVKAAAPRPASVQPSRRARA